MSYILSNNQNNSLPFFQALANIVYEMNVDKVAVITEDERATVQFLTEATYLNIRVTNVLEFKTEAKNTTSQALNFINGLEGPQPVIVMILGMISHKKSQKTIFGHKHEIKNLIFFMKKCQLPLILVSNCKF